MIMINRRQEILNELRRHKANGTYDHPIPNPEVMAAIIEADEWFEKNQDKALPYHDFMAREEDEYCEWRKAQQTTG